MDHPTIDGPPQLGGAQRWNVPAECYVDWRFMNQTNDWFYSNPLVWNGMLWSNRQNLVLRIVGKIEIYHTGFGIEQGRNLKCLEKSVSESLKTSRRYQKEKWIQCYFESGGKRIHIWTGQSHRVIWPIGNVPNEFKDLAKGITKNIGKATLLLLTIYDKMFEETDQLKNKLLYTNQPGFAGFENKTMSHS